MQLARWGLLLLAVSLGGEPALAAVDARTDFGERVFPGAGTKPLTLTPLTGAGASLRRRVERAGAKSLSAAVALARSWGRVTSTYRSVEHNRAVGGMPNSYHLRGRAIDLVRAPGVGHAELDRLFRAAGFQLVESLDEHDHSHFAFAWQGQPAAVSGAGHDLETAPQRTASLPAEVTWKWVYAPGARR